MSGMVRAGEAGGNLGPTLTRIADLLDRQRALALHRHVGDDLPQSSCSIAMIGAVTLLLTEVLPQFVPMFEQSGVALPGIDPVPDRDRRLRAGRWVVHGAAGRSWQATLIGHACGVAARARSGWWWTAFCCELPIVRRPDEEKSWQPAFYPGPRDPAAEWCPADPGAGDRPRCDGQPQAARGSRSSGPACSARGGGSLKTELEAAKVFPIRVRSTLLRLGEETAQLAAMALRAADIHEEKTRLATQRMTSLLVPAMTILMGVAVGGIVASLMTAMLSLNNLASG